MRGATLALVAAAVLPSVASAQDPPDSIPQDSIRFLGGITVSVAKPVDFSKLESGANPQPTVCIGEQGFQLFHANLENQNIRQLTQNANNVTEVKFSRDQQNIIFIDLSLGGSKILSKNISNDAETTTLVEGFKLVTISVLPEIPLSILIISSRM